MGETGLFVDRVSDLGQVRDTERDQMVTTDMKPRKTSRRDFSRAFVLVGAFVFAQLLVQFHGAQYGFAQHSHDGTTCQVAVINEGFEAIEPDGAALPVAPSVCSLVVFDKFQETVCDTRVVATTARSPPLAFNVI